jgi:hypothetical protein
MRLSLSIFPAWVSSAVVLCARNAGRPHCSAEYAPVAGYICPTSWLAPSGAPITPPSFGAQTIAPTPAPTLVPSQAPYQLGTKGAKNCGLGTDITSDVACQNAASALNSAYLGSGSYTDYPAGCHYLPAGVRFNTDLVGGANPESTPICAFTPPPTRAPTITAPTASPTAAPTYAALQLQVSVNGTSVEVGPWDGRAVAFRCLKRTRSPPLNSTGALCPRGCKTSRFCSQ